VITLLLSGAGTFVIGRAINKTIGFRVSHEAETAGVDLAEHAESAYAFGEIGAGFNPLHPASHSPAASADGTVEATSRSVTRTKEDSFA
jgi:Amt family ammonium transporter